MCADTTDQWEHRPGNAGFLLVGCVTRLVRQLLGNVTTWWHQSQITRTARTTNLLTTDSSHVPASETAFCATFNHVTSPCFVIVPLMGLHLNGSHPGTTNILTTENLHLLLLNGLKDQNHGNGWRWLLEYFNDHNHHYFQTLIGGLLSGQNWVELNPPCGEGSTVLLLL